MVTKGQGKPLLVIANDVNRFNDYINTRPKNIAMMNKIYFIEKEGDIKGFGRNTRVFIYGKIDNVKLIEFAREKFNTVYELN